MFSHRSVGSKRDPAFWATPLWPGKTASQKVAPKSRVPEMVHVRRRGGPVAVLGFGFFIYQDPEAICQRFPFWPPRTVPATSRAKRHRRLRQRPAPRKLRSFQKGGRSEGKRAAQRRACPPQAPLATLWGQKHTQSTQRNELRRPRKVSAHDDSIRKSYDNLKFVPRCCALRIFKTHQTLRLYAPAPTFSNNAFVPPGGYKNWRTLLDPKVGSSFGPQRRGQKVDPLWGSGASPRWGVGRGCEGSVRHGVTPPFDQLQPLLPGGD